MDEKLINPNSNINKRVSQDFANKLDQLQRRISNQSRQDKIVNTEPNPKNVMNKVITYSDVNPSNFQNDANTNNFFKPALNLKSGSQDNIRINKTLQYDNSNLNLNHVNKLEEKIVRQRSSTHKKIKETEKDLVNRKRVFSYVVDEKSKLFKIVVPYDFVNKKYDYNTCNFDFYQDKDYIINKIIEFNNNNLFNMDYEYKFTAFEIIKEFIPYILSMIIYIYIGIWILLSSLFNLGILFVLILIGAKIHFFFHKLRFKNAEKTKIKKINSIIERENSSKECKEQKIKWEVGKNGYWLEIHKIT